MARKRDAVKTASTGRGVDFREISFETVQADAINYGLATDVLHQLNAGKEASIYLALWKEHPIILKAYRFWHSSHKLSKKRGYVAEGTTKRTYCILGMVEDLASKEYDYLLSCYRVGVHVPTPIGRVGNYLTMRFIGDGYEPAPQLKDVDLNDPEAVLTQILDDYLLMYSQAHYVHGDLSKYNLLWWKGRAWIIDVPQAVSVGVHTDMLLAEKMLARDIENVLSYFEDYGIHKDADDILEVFLSEYIPHNQRNYRELAQEGELL